MSEQTNPSRHHFAAGAAALRARNPGLARAHFLAAHTLSSPLVSGHALRGMAQAALMSDDGDRTLELLEVARQAYELAEASATVLADAADDDDDDDDDHEVATDEARTDGEAAADLAIDALEGRATCHVMEVDVHFQAGRYDAAQAALDAAYPLYRNIDGRRSQADLWSATARLAQHRQRWMTAGVAWQKVIAIAEEHRDPRMQCNGWLRLAEVRLRDAYLEGATSCLDKAEPTARDLDDPLLLGRLWSAHAALATKRAQHEAAWDMGLDALSHLEGAMDRRLLSTTRLRMAAIAEEARPAEVVPLLREVLDTERQHSHSDMLASVAHRAASFALGQRKFAEALLAARAEEGMAPAPHAARILQVRALLSLGEDIAAAWLAAYQARTVGDDYPAAVDLAKALGDRLPATDDDSFERVATEALPRRDNVVVRIARQRGMPLEAISTPRGIELVLDTLTTRQGAMAVASPEAAVPEAMALVWLDALDNEQVLELPVGVTTIGRGRTNAVQVAWDASVSRAHAAFERLGKTFTVRDLGSEHGTWVNGDRLGEDDVVVVAGDEVRIGQTPFRIEARKSLSVAAAVPAPTATATVAPPR